MSAPHAIYCALGFGAVLILSAAIISRDIAINLDVIIRALRGDQ